MKIENRCSIIAAHFRDLLELKSIRNEADIRESGVKQRAIMCGIQVCGLNPKEKAISALASYIMTSKMETSLVKDWERSHKDNSQ